MNQPLSPSRATIPYKAEGQYVAMCLGCGEPLKHHQRSFRVRDEKAIDFDDRVLIDFMGWFCPDCKERMLGFLQGGIRAAVERMKEKQKTLQLLDKKDREALSQVEEGPECREL